MPKDAKGSLRSCECPANKGQLYVSAQHSRVEEHLEQHDHVCSSVRLYI